MDLNRFRVSKEDYVLLLAEERRQKIGNLWAPVSETGIEKVGHGVGHIIALSGRGKVIRAERFEPGMRVVYRDYVKYAHPIADLEGISEDTWPSGEKKHYFMMNAVDISAIVPEGVDFSVLASRAKEE